MAGAFGGALVNARADGILELSRKLQKGGRKRWRDGGGDEDSGGSTGSSLEYEVAENRRAPNLPSKPPRWALPAGAWIVPKARVRRR